MDGPTSETETILLSVVMPAHNEADFLDDSVAEVSEGLDARGLDYEIIVVENGSTDDTAALAAKLASDRPRVAALSRPGADYGAALRAGFLAARGEIVVNFDVDYFDLDFLDKALELVRRPDGPSVVVGSKRNEDSVDTRGAGRKLVTSVFSTILRLGFGLGVSDTHGVKALRRADLLPLVERSRFGTDLFDTELILRAERAGLRATEIPVVVEERRPSRTPILRRVPRSIAGLARLRVALWRERA